MNHPADIPAIGVLLLRDWARALARLVVLQPGVLCWIAPGCGNGQAPGSILVHVARLRMFRRHVGHKPVVPTSALRTQHETCARTSLSLPTSALRAQPELCARKGSGTSPSPSSASSSRAAADATPSRATPRCHQGERCVARRRCPEGRRTRARGTSEPRGWRNQAAEHAEGAP